MSEQRKIVVSLPSSLVAEADGLALNEKKTRSELVKEALRMYIQESHKRRLNNDLISGYKEMASLNLSIANMCVDADNQALDLCEQKLAECE